MAIYNVNGVALTDCYSMENELEFAYDVDGQIMHHKTDPYLENRILVFEDDFPYRSINTNKWGYEIGYCRNNELQHYRPENITISNGILDIKAIKEHYAGDTQRNSTWTSGSITTSNKFEAYYGRWQAKIKFPKLIGDFGAFWLLGEGCDFGYYDDGTKNYRIGAVGWSQCGEIDVTETIPGNASSATCNLWKADQTSAGTATKTIDISQWHVYEIEWTSTTIAVMVDNVTYKTYDLTATGLEAYILGSSVQNGFYMIVNQAIGASGGTPSADVSEMNMLVDWVRVYAPSSYTNEQIYATSISIPSTLSLSVNDDVTMAVTWTPTVTFDRTTKWTSSDETIVTAHSGRIKALTAGTATITVTTNNNKTATCTVTVS